MKQIGPRVFSPGFSSLSTGLFHRCMCSRKISCFIHIFSLFSFYNQASQLIYQKIKELEDKQKTEAENSHLLLQLQEDFKKEEVFKSDDLFTQELLVEYERIQVILNQSSASARPSTTQEDI